MSQHCRANPCCGDAPCSGVPVPQHASGFPGRNKQLNITEKEENSIVPAARTAFKKWWDAKTYRETLLEDVMKQTFIAGFKAGRATVPVVCAHETDFSSSVLQKCIKCGVMLDMNTYK